MPFKTWQPVSVFGVKYYYWPAKAKLHLLQLNSRLSLLLFVQSNLGINQLAGRNTGALLLVAAVCCLLAACCGPPVDVVEPLGRSWWLHSCWPLPAALLPFRKYPHQKQECLRPCMCVSCGHLHATRDNKARQSTLINAKVRERPAPPTDSCARFCGLTNTLAARVSLPASWAKKRKSCFINEPLLLFAFKCSLSASLSGSFGLSQLSYSLSALSLSLLPLSTGHQIMPRTSLSWK